MEPSAMEVSTNEPAVRRAALSLVSCTPGSRAGREVVCLPLPCPPPIDKSTITTTVMITNTAATMPPPIKTARDMPVADAVACAPSPSALTGEVTADRTLEGDFLLAAFTFVAALAAAALRMAVVSASAGLAPDLATAGTGPDFVTTGSEPDLATAGIEPDSPTPDLTTFELPPVLIARFALEPTFASPLVGESSGFATGSDFTRLLSSVVLPPGEESIPFFVSTRALS